MENAEALEGDHGFLTEGDVFTVDVLETWIRYKRERQIDPVRVRSHSYEFFLYVRYVRSRGGFKRDTPVSSPNNLPSRLGSIQVPGHGLPIILLADRQTTGGYPKIATAISVDVYDLGQAKPGDRIRFSPISVIDAHEIRKRYEKRMKQCIEILNKSEYQMTKIDSAEPSTRAQAEGLVAGRNMFRKLEI